MVTKSHFALLKKISTSIGRQHSWEVLESDNNKESVLIPPALHLQMLQADSLHHPTANYSIL